MSLVLQPDGPGTTVIVRDGVQGLPAAPRGTVAVLETFQSGPTDHAALALTPGAARRISGEAHDDFEGSLALSDVYHHYSPPVLIGRVTDGNDVQGQAYLWDRKPSRGYLHRVDQGDRAPLATVKGHNGGRWSGRARRWLTGTALTLSSALTSNSTLATGETMLEDIYKGADVYFEGDSGGPYRISSNSTAGVLTFESEVSQDVIDASNGASNGVDGHVRIVLEDDLELTVVVGPDTSRGQTFYPARRPQVQERRRLGARGDLQRPAAQHRR